MSKAKTALKVVGGLAVVLGIGIAGTIGWAGSAAEARLSRTYETHRVDIPVPWPLTAEEIDALRAARLAEIPAPPSDPSGAVPPPPDPLAGVDLTAVAKERAVARGKHLLDARYGCRECHGRDLSGGVMVDAPPIGKILGPNLTGGRGSVVANYTMADWDRIVRHGVKPNGAGTMMPAEDHFLMSDRELSDIVTYIRALPPVDNVVPAPVYGPLGKFLIARGEVRIAAELVKDHQAPHAALPPPEEPTVAFGRHLAAVCTGCHGPTLAGGKIPGGDPSWPVASNLTPHAEGLAGDTEEKFTERFRKGLRRDGQPMAPPMSLMVSYASNMTDTEVKALWTYLASLPATATPK